MNQADGCAFLGPNEGMGCRVGEKRADLLPGASNTSSRYQLEVEVRRVMDVDGTKVFLWRKTSPSLSQAQADRQCQ